MATKTTTRKTKAATTTVAISTDPIAEEVGLVREATTLIQEFMKSAVAFFTTAKQLETEALERLEHAKKLQAVKRVPKTAAEDEQLQLSIKTDAALEKKIDTHWAITSTVHQLHKRLVARRQRGADAAAESKKIKNALHNQYVTEEQARTNAENERRRLAAEQVERDRRQKELDDLDAEALKLEESSAGLSEREGQFVDLVMGGMEPTAAAGRVGYKDAFKQAARLMAADKILLAIRDRRTAHALREQAAATKEAPVDYTYEEAKPDISTAVGRDRTTWGHEVTDAAAFVAAVVAGKHGIPQDCLMPNPVKLNEYARSLHERLDHWPGVRHTKKTGLV